MKIGGGSSYLVGQQFRQFGIHLPPRVANRVFADDALAHDRLGMFQPERSLGKPRHQGDERKDATQ
jgi:hypothetical protein